MLTFFENHWLLLSFLAPMFWALVNMIDVYFVDGIYKDEMDGTIIAGFFQLIPLIILCFFVDFNLLGKNYVNSRGGSFFDLTLLQSFLGGIFFLSAFYFYFKTLFNHNDVSLLQILWNLTIVFVPVLAFLFFGETLPIYKYASILVVLVGATMLSFDMKTRKRISVKYFWTMMGAVLFLSLSMLVEERAYEALDLSYGSQGFLLGFFFFGLGAFVTGLLFAIYAKRNPLPLIKKYYKIFLLSEGIYFLGNFASQRALDVAPSVSYVAVAETFGPIFILIYSFVILFISSYIIKKNNKIVKRIYAEQLSGVGIKIIAILIMAIGVYIMANIDIYK